MSTPSKLDIIRAVGQVQREIAASVGAGAGAGTVSTDQAVVHPPPDDNVTTRRRRQDPLEQMSSAQDELSEVQSDLRGDQQLLQRLCQVHYPDGEEFEDGLGEGGIDDDVNPDPDPGAGDSAPPFIPDWFAKVIGAAVAAASSATSSNPSSRSTKLKITDRKLPDFWE